MLILSEHVQSKRVTFSDQGNNYNIHCSYSMPTRSVYSMHRAGRHGTCIIANSDVSHFTWSLPLALVEGQEKERCIKRD